MGHTMTATAPRPAWHLRQQDPTLLDRLATRCGISKVAAAVLANRQLTDLDAVKHLLNPSLHQLRDPLLLPDMRAAVERIQQAIARAETILIHGDYDVDGVTGTTILVKALSFMGAKVRWHIPDRHKDGYAFGPHSLEKVRETGATLVVSVDSGTSAHEWIEKLSGMGVDVVVTDHHEPKEGPLPRCVAIVNAKRADSSYPFRELCGGGVAFKLAWALATAHSGGERASEQWRQLLMEFIGYAAIATVCDVVPMRDENRVIAHYGLQQLRKTDTPGMRALMAVCDLPEGRVSTTTIGFQIGPRINAAGRLANARIAVELFLATEAAEAQRLAAQVNVLNIQRKDLERVIADEAAKQAERWHDARHHPVLVLASETWDPGVVGIVAGRMVARTGRPAIVLGIKDGLAKGSARTVHSLDLMQVMKAGDGLYTTWGGHAMAAGCTLPAAHVDELRARLVARTRELLNGQAPPPRRLEADYELPLALYGDVLMNELERLEPWGQDFREPVFLTRDLRVADAPYIMGKDRKHFSLRFRSGDTVVKAKAFNMAERVQELTPGTPIHVLWKPDRNTFRGITANEMTIEDFAVGEAPLV
jgi:single-stranded-DNA-specific exonuclease